MKVKYLCLNTVQINDVNLEVPADFNFVTIDVTGDICGWINRPSLSDGYWTGDFAISLGKAELEPEDQWCSVFVIYDNS